MERKIQIDKMSAFAEEEEEYEEISAEEKLRIATHFLLSAPSGEIQDLLGDVRKVIGTEVLSEAALGNVFRTYNIENHTLAEVEDGKFMLVSKHGEVDGTHYVDPRAGKVYGFNHMTQVRLNMLTQHCCAEKLGKEMWT